MSFDERSIVLRPGEGRTVSVRGDRYTYKATADQTGGAYGLVETAVPAGSAGPPPHIHPGEEEAFYVLEGELTVLLDERELVAPAGAFLLVPRGTVHTFSNRTQREARLLVIISPGGFEGAFAEMAEVIPSAEEPPDMERLMAIARKYNLEIVAPPQ
jgi:quercetin dioxygenase-like cupin family protein